MNRKWATFLGALLPLAGLALPSSPLYAQTRDEVCELVCDSADGGGCDETSGQVCASLLPSVMFAAGPFAEFVGNVCHGEVGSLCEEVSGPGCAASCAGSASAVLETLWTVPHPEAAAGIARIACGHYPVRGAEPTRSMSVPRTTDGLGCVLYFSGVAPRDTVWTCLKMTSPSGECSPSEQWPGWTLVSDDGRQATACRDYRVGSQGEIFLGCGAFGPCDPSGPWSMEMAIEFGGERFVRYWKFMLG